METYNTDIHIFVIYTSLAVFEKELTLKQPNVCYNNIKQQQQQEKRDEHKPPV